MVPRKLLMLLVLCLAAFAPSSTTVRAESMPPPLNATLKPGNGASGSSAGYSLATSTHGSSVVALAPSNTINGKGSTAYVFVRSGQSRSTTTQQSQLSPSEDAVFYST